MRRNRGFTLIEMIMTMVMTGILAGMVAVFIARPIEGYIASGRRAALTDTADLAIKRMAIDLHTAVPNSIRLRSTGSSSVTSCSASLSSTCYLEYLPTRSGGRYCTDTDVCPTSGGELSFSTSNDYFDILGPAHDILDTDFLVIYNTGQTVLNAYAGYNIRAVSSHTASGVTVSGTAFPFASPSSRFQAVPSTGPVTYACDSVAPGSTGTGNLHRYTSYATTLPFGATQPMPGTGGALLADRLTACSFTYDAASATDGIVTIQLTLTRDSESVTLRQQVHVENIP
jgi:MSHA biogenesis protein MshO